MRFRLDVCFNTRRPHFVQFGLDLSNAFGLHFDDVLQACVVNLPLCELRANHLKLGEDSRKPDVRGVTMSGFLVRHRAKKSSAERPIMKRRQS